MTQSNEQTNSRKNKGRIAANVWLALGVPALILYYSFSFQSLLNWWEFLLTPFLWFILVIDGFILAKRANTNLRNGKQLLGTIYTVGSGLCFAVVLVPITTNVYFWYDRRENSKCFYTNYRHLQYAFEFYADDYDGKLPTGSKWCDLIGDRDEPGFLRCAGDPKGPCSYAMNKHAVGMGTDMPADMVLLFESKPGWNQVGGPELLNPNNHRGGRCFILLRHHGLKVVTVEEARQLRWEVGEERKEEEAGIQLDFKNVEIPK